MFNNIIANRFGKTEVALFLIALFLFIANIRFWMDLILGNAEASNRRSLPLSEAQESFHCNTYELCNPIDKLKARVALYKKYDFFSLRQSSLWLF